MLRLSLQASLSSSLSNCIRFVAKNTHTHTYIYTSCALTVCTTSEILNISLTIPSRPAQLSMAAIRHSIIAAIALCSRVASRKQKVEVSLFGSGINLFSRDYQRNISNFRNPSRPKNQIREFIIVCSAAESFTRLMRMKRWCNDVSRR